MLRWMSALSALSARLTAMFAVCSAIVFTVAALLLHASLASSLEEQIDDELELHATLLESLVQRNPNPASWPTHVVAKLDSVTQEQGGPLVWILGSDPQLRYGRPPPGLERLADRAGTGTLHVDGRRNDLITLTRVLPATPERGALRLVVARDPERFWQTLDRFRIALITIVILGVALVSALGWWIARVGLQPLRRLSRQAHGLHPQRPAQRLGLDPLPAELSDLTASFNGALERLERAHQQLEAFNANVAHELRTPLMNLIGQTQVMLTRPRPAAELADTLHSNLEELERLRAVVNDMLFLARADQGALARDAVEVSLNGEVAKVTEFLEPLIDEAGVRVRVAGDASIAIETALFRRAVSNLLQNALQHSAAGDEIVVTIGREASGYSVSVSNPGACIDEQHLTHLFDRFYRADSARPNSVENHGLGLAIVKAVATMHRGAVFARSSGGTNTFGFTLARPG